MDMCDFCGKDADTTWEGAMHGGYICSSCEEQIRIDDEALQYVLERAKLRVSKPTPMRLLKLRAARGFEVGDRVEFCLEMDEGWREGKIVKISDRNGKFLCQTDDFPTGGCAAWTTEKTMRIPHSELEAALGLVGAAK